MEYTDEIKIFAGQQCNICNEMSMQCGTFYNLIYNSLLQIKSFMSHEYYIVMHYNVYSSLRTILI